MAYNIIIGGGITGLFSAHVLQKRMPHIPVILVEAATKIGGLLKSKNYKDHGAFDYGIHAFYETGVDEIDNYFLDLPIDWKFLTGYNRDLGGAAWENKINYDAPYLDVSTHKKQGQYLRELWAAIDSKGPAIPPKNAQDWLSFRYGISLTENILAKAIAARQHQSAKDVHWLAARVQGLERVVACDERTVLENYKTSKFSSRIAFPNQREYPAEIIPNRKTYYPKDIGIGQVIKAIGKDLQQRGVTILTSAKLVHAKSGPGKVESVALRHSDGNIREYDVHSVVCSAPLPAFLFALDKKPPAQSFKPPHQTVICNFISRVKPNDGGLYYIFLHGHPRMHRVSFPYNYSDEDIGKRGGYPLCVEAVYPREENTDKAAQMALSGLIESGVIYQTDDIIFQNSYVSQGGYPNMCVENIDALEFYRNYIAEMQLSNLKSVGILSRDDLFFQFDLIKHANEILA